MSEDAVDSEVTTRDIGNGLVVLGLILLAVYVTFVLLPASLYSEYSNPVWTEPRVAPGFVILFAVLITIGAVLRGLSPLPDEEESWVEEEE